MSHFRQTASRIASDCAYNVSQHKIRTFANKHVKNGHEFKTEEGLSHQIECAPVEPLLAQLQAFVNFVQTRETARRRLGWLRFRACVGSGDGIGEERKNCGAGVMRDE